MVGSYSFSKNVKEIFYWCFPTLLILFSLPCYSCCAPFDLGWLSSLFWGHHCYLLLILFPLQSPGYSSLSLFLTLRLSFISWLLRQVTSSQTKCWVTDWLLTLNLISPLLLLYHCTTAQERCWELLVVGNIASWWSWPHWVKIWAQHISLVFHRWTYAFHFSQLFSTLTQSLFEECFSLTMCDLCSAGYSRTLVTNIPFWDIRLLLILCRWGFFLIL